MARSSPAPRAVVRSHRPHAATLATVRARAEATQRGAGAFDGALEGARPETLQRLQAPNIALRDPTAAARGIEQRAHGGLRVLSPQTYAGLNTSERYLWLVRGNGNGGLEIVVARRAGDRIGHPTLAYVGAPNQHSIACETSGERTVRGGGTIAAR